MPKMFVLSVIAAVVVSGCGYKAPPYYEKPISQKGSDVAL